MPSRISFAENLRQWDEKVRYRADFRGGRLFLEDSCFTFLFEHPEDMQALHPSSGRMPRSIRLHALRLLALGAAKASVSGSTPAPYHHNYFIGKDPSKWASNVRVFESVTYSGLYPGIDMKFYGSASDVTYDFIVHPGGTPSDIRLEYRGAERMELKDGELHIATSVGEVILRRPYAYQMIDGILRTVPCRFMLKSGVLRFILPDGYDTSRPLVIDPTLVFASYTGSYSDNWGFTATYDAAGNLYAGGNISGVGYPITVGAYQITYAGGSGAGNGWDCDMAIAKFNATGTSLLYATYLGGGDNEQPQSLIVDADRRLVIFGTTTSPTFPVTAGAYRTTFAGSADIVVSKLSENGDSLIASTFVGGSADDGLNTSPFFSAAGPLKYNYSDESRGEIITYPGGYVIGSSSQSSNFPTTTGCLQPALNGPQDGVVFMLDNSLSTLLWSTYLGGAGEDAVYDVLQSVNNEFYVCGGTTSTDFPTTSGVLHPNYQGGRADGFISRMGGNGSALSASTYIGTGAYDQTYFVETDDAGDVYTTGQTEGIYPVTAGAYSNPNSGQFIHKLDAGLSNTAFSTVFGSGSSVPNISPTAFLVDTCRNIYVSGWGRCLDLGVFVPGNCMGMPVTPNALQPSTDGCDFYFIVFDASASSLIYATYFGGSSSSEHVDGGTSRFDKNGVIYQSVCAGCGGFSDFPTTNGAVSATNNSGNCNNGVIKLAFEVARTVAASAATPAYGCSPLTVNFDNTSVNAQSYLWDFDDGSPPDTTSDPVHVFTVPGTYDVRLIALNPNSCSVSDTAHITVTVTGAISPVASFTVNPTVTCDSLTVAVDASGSSGSVLSWEIDGTSAPFGSSFQYAFTDTGTHTIQLTVSDTACPVSPDTSVQSLYLPGPVSAVAGFTSDPGQCLPVTVQFTSTGSSVAAYYWDFGDGSPVAVSNSPQHVYSAPGTYYVLLVVEDIGSCNVRDTAILVVNIAGLLALDSSFMAVLPPQCDSFTVLFAANPPAGTVPLWQLGNGADTSGAAVFTHDYAAPGNYLVTYTVTDTACNRQATSVQLVHLPGSVEASIAVSGNQSGCAPQTVELSNAFPAAYYSWDLGNGNTSTSDNVTVTYMDPGDYHIVLTASDPLSCNLQAVDSFTVSVYPSPTALFEISSEEVYDYTEVMLTDNSLEADSIYWDLGDGSFSLEQHLLHRYDSPGIYRICLYAVSSGGCIDSACTDLEQPPVESIFLPNCFTPNGDDRNEVFKAETVGIIELNVRIYNRWGRMIYEFNTPQGYWDGTTNGIPAQEAVYDYLLKARGIVSGEFERTGRVTLLR